MLQISGENFQFYRHIDEVILKIHCIKDKKIKVKVYANQPKSVSHILTLHS